MRWEGWKESLWTVGSLVLGGGPRLPYLGKASLVRLPLRRLSLLSTTLSSFLSSPTSNCSHRPRRRLLPSCLSLFFIVWPIRIPSFLWDPLHSFGCTSLTFTFTIRFRHSLLRPPNFFESSPSRLRLTYSSFSCQIQRSIYTTLSPTSDSSRFLSIPHFCRLSAIPSHLRNTHSLNQSLVRLV